MTLKTFTRVCVAGFVLFPLSSHAALPVAVSNVFDEFSGATLETTFGPPESENWVTGSLYELAAHSGTQFFESDNGNFNHDFLQQRYVKQLGGTIQPGAYEVSFFIAANSLGGIGMHAVEFSDFSDLAIGGPGGTMLWLDTPTPGVGQGWVEWSGLYTPSITDIGLPFRFRMTVDIDSRHSVAIDGPMTARLIPEPPTGLMIAAMISVLCGLGSGCRLTW
jgi:hypothetical protein